MSHSNVQKTNVRMKKHRPNKISIFARFEGFGDPVELLEIVSEEPQLIVKKSQDEASAFLMKAFQEGTVFPMIEIEVVSSAGVKEFKIWANLKIESLKIESMYANVSNSPLN